MAQNPDVYYGNDLACLEDADDLFSGVVGLPVLLQDLYHRVTTRNVMGPGGEDWGDDCTTLLGMATAKALQQGPRFSAAVQRDPRVQTADVSIVQGQDPYSYVMSIAGLTAAGPFSLILGISTLTIDVLDAQAPV